MTSCREKCTCVHKMAGVKKAGGKFKEGKKKGKIHRFLNKCVKKLKLKLDYKATMLRN